MSSSQLPPITPTTSPSLSGPSTTGIISPQKSSLMLPSPLSMREANLYYHGLPSDPVLVARTGTTPWIDPTGPEAYLQFKELRPVGKHALSVVWEDSLAPRLHALLDSMEVNWTSTDVVRIGIPEPEDYSTPIFPVILWIGVMPKSLSGDVGSVVASQCQDLLLGYGIADIDVEIRESVVTRSAGPALLAPSQTPVYSSTNPTVDIRNPLTTTLGVPICAQATPWAQGSGGFFITEDGNTKRLLLITARHVIFPPDQNENKYFKHKNDSQHHHDVLLFSDMAFTKYLESIKDKIRGQEILAEYQQACIRSVRWKYDSAANRARHHAQAKLEGATEAREVLKTFYQDVLKNWATQESRILGHVILAPPINSGKGYTEDWAIIEIDSSKVNASNFNTNVLDLGTNMPVHKFIPMICANLPDFQSFEYPFDHLLRLEGTIPYEEMCHSTASDDPYLMVIKCGSTTGLTIGRANNLCSYARNYHNLDYNGGQANTVKEWAILPLDSKSGAFSAKGDSGSVIVDKLGRIGGLLTSGAGSTESSDITYATPISFLLKAMEDNGLNKPNIHPVLTV